MRNVIKKAVSVVVIFSIMLVLSNSTATAASNKSFTDVKAGSWYKDHVDSISSRGIITGYGNGKFGPNDKLQVDHLITMMIKANKLQVKKEPGDKYWAAPYIRKATELGWVKEGEFTEYNINITREQISRIIARAMTDYPDNYQDYKSLIKDFNTIDVNFRDYILKVYAKGIVAGYTDGAFKSINNATRAEAAAMIVKYLEPSKRTEYPIVIGDTQQVINGFVTGVVGKTSSLARISGEDLSVIGDDYPYLQLCVGLYYDADRTKDMEQREIQFAEVRKILTQKIDAKTVDAAIAYGKTKKHMDERIKYDKDFASSGYCIRVSSFFMDEDITFSIYKEKYARN